MNTSSNYKIKALNIALLGDGFVGWGGGLDFIRLCANALTMVCNQGANKLTLLLPDPENATFTVKARSFISPYKVVVMSFLAGKRPVFNRYRVFSRQQLEDAFQNIDGRLDIVFYQRGKDLRSIVAEVGADVVIPCLTSLGKHFPVPWVGYLYDFQHKYYPNYFSNREISSRDRQFEQMLSEASAVIVNAADVAKDIKKFYSATNCKVFSLPFSATPIESWFEAPSEHLQTKYGLPDKYFIICNQFWIHKDHSTAFDAFAKFCELTEKDDVNLVCTGNTVDFRQPDYFPSLNTKLIELGIVNKVHILGHISKKDQIDIMKNAIAVLQPTLFEGGPGGGAVYDAVALGVPVVLSDIPVNREIEELTNVIFFKPQDANDMAQKMIATELSAFIKPDKTTLLSEGRDRTRDFGFKLLDAIKYVVSAKDNTTQTTT